MLSGMCRLIAILVILFMGAVPASSASQGAIPLFSLADQPSVLATAGSTAPLSRGAGALFENPAGVADQPGILYAAHGWLYEGIYRSSGAFAMEAPGLDRFRIGIAVTSIGYGDIERRIGPSTLPSGTYGAHDTKVGFSLACDAGKGFRAGVTGSILDAQIGGQGASGWSVDAGVQKALPQWGIEMGAYMSNLGHIDAFTQGEGSDLWVVYQAGIAWMTPWEGFRFSGAIRYEDEGNLLELIGVEYGFWDRYALRAGRAFGHDTRGFAAGMGIDLGELGFAYSWEEYRLDLGSTHRIAITWMQ